MLRPPTATRLLPPLLLLLLPGCQSSNGDDEPRQTEPIGPPLQMAEAWTPPADWATLPPAAFEELVLNALPEDAITPFGPGVLEELVAALDRMDPSSVRAAVMLGRSRHPWSGDVLLRRLQKRVLGPERESDAGDIVAAAALSRFPQPEHYWRLVRMVEPGNPHPDLEVRVECAASALHAGFDRVIPFLLKVVRIGTPAGLDDERDFAVPDTSAWARSRAAEALSERAGVPVTYRADAPMEARQREARRLEELLTTDGAAHHSSRTRTNGAAHRPSRDGRLRAAHQAVAIRRSRVRHRRERRRYFSVCAQTRRRKGPRPEPS